jgi:hypothetical protein
MELIIFTSPDAGRAAMAAAFFNDLATPAVACALAAVPDPDVSIEAQVAAGFDELRLGRSLLPPSRFTAQLGAWAAEIIQVGITTRSFPIRDVRTVEWDIASPTRRPLAEVKAIRDAIRDSVEGYLRRKQWLRDPTQRSTQRPAEDL